MRSGGLRVTKKKDNSSKGENSVKNISLQLSRSNPGVKWRIPRKSRSKSQRGLRRSRKSWRSTLLREHLFFALGMGKRRVRKGNRRGEEHRPGVYRNPTKKTWAGGDTCQVLNGGDDGNLLLWWLKEKGRGAALKRRKRGGGGMNIERVDNLGQDR